MSTTDTSSIDDKKNDSTGASNGIDIKGFFKNYISSILFTIIISVFIIGSLGLYTTKVAQANILPDDINLAPYTNLYRPVEEMPIDINIKRANIFFTSNDDVSQKAQFLTANFLASFKNSFICKLKTYSSPNASWFSNGTQYFSSVYDSMCAVNYWAITTIFYYLSFLPEPFIMLLYSFFGIFLWIGLYFFNICTCLAFHFFHIPQLVRNAHKNNRDEWQAQADITFFNWKTLFLGIWFIPVIISVILFPIFNTIYGILTPLTATYKIKGDKSSQSHDFWDFLKDTFMYKKLFFLVLATFSLISNGSAYLGPSSLIYIIIAIVVAYYMGIYNSDIPSSGTDNFTSGIRQHVKIAKIGKIDPNVTIDICTPPAKEGGSSSSSSTVTSEKKLLIPLDEIKADFQNTLTNDTTSEPIKEIELQPIKPKETSIETVKPVETIPKETPIKPVETIPKETPIKPVETVKPKEIELQTINPITNTTTTVTKIEPAAQPQPVFTNNQVGDEQLGGGKRVKTKVKPIHQKKYNIRFI